VTIYSLIGHKGKMLIAFFDGKTCYYYDLATGHSDHGFEVMTFHSCCFCAENAPMFGPHAVANQFIVFLLSYDYNYDFYV